MKLRIGCLMLLSYSLLAALLSHYTMFKSFKWALLILANVAMARIGGLLALLITGTNFSVSSGVGFLALFGVSVQTGVIMLEYINQLRARRYSIEDAAVEGAVLRLRPIMMTMLVATLGLLPAALSHAIGSDSQRPFAIVIVGGLIADLLMSRVSRAAAMCDIAMLNECACSIFCLASATLASKSTPWNLGS
jgi:cobalt-zinc-cadmium resistance protein CzcA